MNFTQQEEKLLHEAEAYSLTQWRKKTQFIGFLCGMFGACTFIIVGIIDMAMEKLREGLTFVGLGGILLGFALQSYGAYRYRKRCLLLIQKLIWK